MTLLLFWNIGWTPPRSGRADVLRMVKADFGNRIDVVGIAKADQFSQRIKHGMIKKADQN